MNCARAIELFLTDRAVVLAAAAGWVFCLVKGLI